MESFGRCHVLFLGHLCSSQRSTAPLASLARRSPAPAPRACHPQDCSARTTVVRWSQRCASRLPRSISTGSDSGEGALISTCAPSLLRHHSLFSAVAAGSETRRASPLHVDGHESPGNQLAEAARSRALRHSRSKSSHGQISQLCESELSLEARSIKLGPSTLGLDYF